MTRRKQLKQRSKRLERAHKAAWSKCQQKWKEFGEDPRLPLPSNVNIDHINEEMASLYDEMDHMEEPDRSVARIQFRKGFFGSGPAYAPSLRHTQLTARLQTQVQRIETLVKAGTLTTPPMRSEGTLHRSRSILYKTASSTQLMVDGKDSSNRAMHGKIVNTSDMHSHFELNEASPSTSKGDSAHTSRFQRNPTTSARKIIRSRGPVSKQNARDSTTDQHSFRIDYIDGRSASVIASEIFSLNDRIIARSKSRVIAQPDTLHAQCDRTAGKEIDCGTSARMPASYSSAESPNEPE